jgi:hypothetical protein
MLATASLAMDDLLASTGVSYRALTMPSFMDNLLRQVELIKSRGVFFSPRAGSARASLSFLILVARCSSFRVFSCGSAEVYSAC